MDFPHVEGPFIIALWILVSSLAKVGKKIMRSNIELFFVKIFGLCTSICICNIIVVAIEFGVCKLQTL